MAVEYISYGNDDGTVFGRSDEKIGFYGLATPIVKPTLTLTTGDTTTHIASDLAAVKAALVALGLVGA